MGASFVIKSLDPGRTIETTSEMVDHATYDSLVTFAGEDLKTALPSLATEWKISADSKMYTFTIRQGVKFASGNPLTADDVKWSFERVKNLKGNPAFLLDSLVSVEATDPQHVVLNLRESHTDLLAILSSPSLGILDGKLVKENGGDASANAKDVDKAEAYLNTHSAGTGPYMLETYTPEQELVLVRNPNYWRAKGPSDRIVIRNITESATQKLQVEAGSLDIAITLGPDQITALKGSAGVTTKASASVTTFYVLLNNNPAVGGAFSNPKVQQAVRYALDYDGIMALAGPGAVRLAGVIPTLLPGSIESSQAPKMDRAKATALLKEANLGEVKGAISYSTSPSAQGVQVSVLVQKIQSDLAAVGMTITLNGTTSATALQAYRDAKNQIGVWSWAADWPDASDFLVFAPGRTVGKRAGWPEDASPQATDIADTARKAESATDSVARAALYQQFEQKLRDFGPFVPMFQPAVPYAFRSNVKGVTFNSVWGVDLYAVSKE
jgi:peptide/nickel transport system substrate-binding protein